MNLYAITLQAYTCKTRSYSKSAESTGYLHSRTARFKCAFVLTAVRQYCSSTEGVFQRCQCDCVIFPLTQGNALGERRTNTGVPKCFCVSHLHMLPLSASPLPDWQPSIRIRAPAESSCKLDSAASCACCRRSMSVISHTLTHAVSAHRASHSTRALHGPARCGAVDGRT